MSASGYDSERDENEEEEIDCLDDNPTDLYGITDGILFIIDGTPPMFERGPEDTECYFLQCLRRYEEILKEKLNWSRQDYMGLVLLGTEKGDVDSQFEHILTLHKLDLISLDNLKETMKITAGKWRYYMEMSSQTSYPLHHAFWHATEMYASIKLTMSSRKVVLFTCRDNPPMVDNDEKHRIRLQASDFKKLDIQLYVCGLSSNWNEKTFYKDLEILSRNINEEDYERVLLKDFVTQIKFAARNMAQLPLTFGENLTVDVSMRNLTVKSVYLKPAYLSRETNAPLTTRTTLIIDRANVPSEDEENEANTEDLPILEDELSYTQEFGGYEISFSSAEVRNVRILKEPGISVLCAQPISYHPFYHENAPYFISSGKTRRRDNELFFSILVKTCTEKDIMLTCTASLRQNATTSLYNLIPSQENGGFFLQKIPFKEDVLRLDSDLSEYVYKEEYHKPPTDEEGIELFNKIVQNVSFDYDPDMFSNPKLKVEMKGLEALVLDLEVAESPEDQTIPPENDINEKLAPVMDDYRRIFNRRESMQANEFEDDQIRELVESDMLHSYTVPQLKSMLKQTDLSCVGKKPDLIDRLKQHFSKD